MCPVGNSNSTAVGLSPRSRAMSAYTSGAVVGGRHKGSGFDAYSSSSTRPSATNTIWRRRCGIISPMRAAP